LRLSNGLSVSQHAYITEQLLRAIHLIHALLLLLLLLLLLFPADVAAAQWIFCQPACLCH
jgi:hypothetical protein